MRATLPIDTIICGDALVELRKLPDACVDAICCDPPAGIFFMSKRFDHNRGGRDTWIAWLAEIMREALRCLKAGGHALVWSLPRTSHWTATALEDAGFEIRDVLYHLYSPDSKVAAFYATLSQEQRTLFEQVIDSQDTPSSVLSCFGSGFPKSLDVGKAIDRMAGVECEVVGMKRAGIGRHGRTDDEVFHSTAPEHLKQVPITAPATDLARQHQGKGSALKPACENWLLVRKPLAQPTLAAQVLNNGCGALNIDASRVGKGGGGWNGLGSTHNEAQWRLNNPDGIQRNTKRWPSHLLLSHSIFCIPHDDTYHCAENCPIRVMDEQSGERKGATSNSNGRTAIFRQLAKDEHGDTIAGYTDTGGASRYFKNFPPFLYAAKASRRERNNGCEALPELMALRYGEKGQGPLPQQTPHIAKPETNNHPTVKSLYLMKYLCKLITPDNGIILDCFAGSGSTLVAAISEGYHFVGIEQDVSYVDIANARIRHARREVGVR